MGGFLVSRDPLLGRPALVVEADDRSVRPRERGGDEAHPGKQLPEVMLDLRRSLVAVGPMRRPGSGSCGTGRAAGSWVGRGVGRAGLRWPAPGRHWPGGGSRTSPPVVPAPHREGGRTNAASERATTVCGRARERSLRGRRTSPHPFALWTLPGRSEAARQSPSSLKTKSGW
jgi:hypothetical protein